MSCRIFPTVSGALAVLGLTLAGAAHALDFGHARLLSGVGQALRADMALVRLSPQEAADVQVRVAPAAAWDEAGLTPPVDLASLQLRLLPGVTADARTLRITSDQVFSGDVADFLIDVSTPGAALRHQVSLVPQHRTIRLAAGAMGVASVPGDSAVAIRVRRGDTLFAIAEQNAVAGFSIYQMMAALFVDNADAFIDANMNLVKAGATLRLPDAATLAHLSDRQARQLFVAHAQALAQRRGGRGVSLAADTDAALSTQALSDAPSAAIEPEPAAEAPQDQLRLRGVGAGTNGADTGATDPDAQTVARRALQDRLARIAQLEQNVAELNQVLRALESSSTAQTGQGEAPGSIAENRDRSGSAGTADSAALAAGSTAAGDVPAPRSALQDALRRIEDIQQSARALDQSLRAEAHPQPPETVGGAVMGAETTEAPSTLADVARAPAQETPAAAPPAATPASADVQDALRRIEQLQESAQALDQSLRAQAGEGAADAAPAPGSAPVTAPPAPSTPIQTSPTPPAASAQDAQAAPGVAVDASAPLWPWLAAAVALLALIVAGLLRRTRATESGEGKITDAMIQEKLKTIDLNLGEDDPASAAGDSTRPS